MDPTEVRAARDALGLIQSKAAELRGVDVRSWGRWERGDAPPPDDLEQWFRYRAVIDQELATLGLEEEEALTVAAALWDWRPSPWDRPNLWQELARSADNITPQLTAKARAAGPGTAWAVVDALERVRQGGSGSDDLDALREVGLARR